MTPMQKERALAALGAAMAACEQAVAALTDACEFSLVDAVERGVLYNAGYVYQIVDGMEVE